MSYTFNKEIEFKPYHEDAFGRLRTSEFSSILELKHTYDKNPLLVDEIINGSATSTFTPNHSDIEMTTSSNSDYVIRQTKGRGVYSPGKSALFEATFMNFHKQTNIIKRVGYFSSSIDAPYNGTFDGFFLESNGTSGVNTISFQIWRYGEKTFESTIDQWDASVIDPTTIDWQNNSLMFVDFAWLGVGTVRFGIWREGEPIIFASFHGDTIIDPYMANPNQPIRYEIRQSGSGSGLFHQLCSVFASEGDTQALTKTASIANTTERTLTTPGVKYPLIGYRCSSNWKGSNIVLESLFALNQVTGTDYLITVEINSGVTGPSLSWQQLANTPIEWVQGTGATIVSTPGHIIKSYIGKGNAATTDNYSLVDNLIRPGVCINGTQDIIWICVTPLIISGSTKIRAITANLNYYD